MESVKGKWALVTGASSGIGKDFAIALAEKGVNLVLAARRVEPMQQLAGLLGPQHGIQVRVEGIDLTKPGISTELKDRLDADGIVIDILINNAGFGVTGEFTDQPTAKLISMIQLNILALTELSHVYAHAMQARRSGYILLVASVAAFQPCPLLAAYGATKAYVLSLGEALHAELAKHNVVVTVLSPGVTESEFFNVAGQPPSAAMKQMMMKSRPVVDIGLKAMFANKSGVVAGATNKFLTLGSRILTRHFASKIGYKMMKL